MSNFSVTFNKEGLMKEFEDIYFKKEIKAETLEQSSTLTFRTKKIITLADIDKKTDEYALYYCANIKERTFECSTELIYKKNGGFPSYPYCSTCYNKWDQLKKDQQESKRRTINYKARSINLKKDPFDSDDE